MIFKHHLIQSCGISQGTALGQRALSQIISCYAAMVLVEGVRCLFIIYFEDTGSLLLLFHSLILLFFNRVRKP